MSVNFIIVHGQDFATLKNDKNLKLIAKDTDTSLHILSYTYTDEETNEENKSELGLYEETLTDNNKLHYAKFINCEPRYLLKYLWEKYGTMFFDDFNSDEQEFIIATSEQLNEPYNLTENDINSYVDYFCANAMINCDVVDEELKEKLKMNEKGYIKVVAAVNDYRRKENEENIIGDIIEKIQTIRLNEKIIDDDLPF